MRSATESGRRLSEIGRDELKEHSDLLDDAYYEVLADHEWIESKRSEGGTASGAVARQLDLARAALTQIRVNVPE